MQENILRHFGVSAVHPVLNYEDFFQSEIYLEIFEYDKILELSRKEKIVINLSMTPLNK